MARMIVAGRALASLGKNPMALSELFVAGAGSPNTEVIEANAGKSRRWQRELMARLVRDGVAEEVGHDTYQLIDDVKRLAIMSNLVEEDGTMLSRYLFYSDADFVSESTEVDLGGYTEEKAMDDVDAAVRGEKPGKAVNAKDLAELATAVESVANLQRVLVEATGKNHISFANQLTATSDVLQQAATAVQQLHDVVVQKEGALAKRIEKLESRQLAALNVLEAMQSTFKSILTKLEAIDGAAEREQSNQKLVEDLVAESRATLSRWDALGQQLDAARRDGLMKIVDRLGAHIRDGQALHEMILELDKEATS